MAGTAAHLKKTRTAFAKAILTGPVIAALAHHLGNALPVRYDVVSLAVTPVANNAHAC